MTTKAEWLVWETQEVDGVCVLDDLLNYEDSFNLSKGISLLDSFPEDVQFTMDEDFPNDTLFADCLLNTDELAVISDRLASFLTDEKLQRAEFLPVSIIDHKGKVAPHGCKILNPIGLVDCLLLDECNPTWGNVDKEKIFTVEKLAIDVSKLDPELRLFRPKFFDKEILVRSDLAAKLDAGGFSGLGWIPVDEYP